MDVSDVKALDEDGYLSRSITIKANSKIVKEQIWTNRFAIKMESHPLDSDTDPRCKRSVCFSVRKEAYAHRVLPSRRHRWNVQKAVERQMQKIQEMCHIEVQTFCLMPDLEQTATQSPGSMLQISSRRA